MTDRGYKTQRLRIMDSTYCLEPSEITSVPLIDCNLIGWVVFVDSLTRVIYSVDNSVSCSLLCPDTRIFPLCVSFEALVVLKGMDLRQRSNVSSFHLGFVSNYQNDLNPPLLTSCPDNPPNLKNSGSWCLFPWYIFTLKGSVTIIQKTIYNSTFTCPFLRHSDPLTLLFIPKISYV